jgi:hypothetical protein
MIESEEKNIVWYLLSRNIFSTVSGIFMLAAVLQMGRFMPVYHTGTSFCC